MQNITVIRLKMSLYDKLTVWWKISTLTTNGVPENREVVLSRDAKLRNR
jgi:hypothetical protein